MIVWFYSKTCVVFAELANHLKNNSGLNIDVVNYFEDVKDNKMAQSFIIETVKKDILNEDLNEKYKELQASYFGDVAKATEYSCYEWSRIPHFYRPYYVYKYSTGFITACTIAQNILKGDKEYLKKYKNFLSAGSSIPPIELLKTVGVDLTKKQTLQGAFELYKSLLKEFEELTKE